MNNRNIMKIGDMYYFLRIESGNYLMYDTKKSILKIKDLNDYITHLKNQAINLSFSDISMSNTKADLYSKLLMRSDYNNYIIMFEIVYNHDEIDIQDVINIKAGDIVYSDIPLRITSTRSFW